MGKLKYNITCFLLLFSVTVFAQNQFSLVNDIQVARTLNKESFEATGILQPEINFKNDHIFDNVKKADYFIYNVDVANEIIKSSFNYISFEISLSNKRGNTWTLDLIEVPESFYNYNVTTTSGKNYRGNIFNGKHYRGVIRGMEEESIVAVSFFNNEMMGVISIKNEGNFNIGKIENEQVHILYKDLDFINPPSFKCDTPDDGAVNYERDLLMNNPVMRSGTDKCVKMYVETEYDIYQNKGSIDDVVNYITGLFNQVAVMFLAENIVTEISEIKVWDTTDPYTGENTLTLLNQFQNEINSFNGDLGQLLTFRGVGGGRAAGFNGICNSNVDKSLMVSGIQTAYSNVPNYSWSVMVVTHELGHLFGSRHTHACVWNGNNTQIDDCGNLWASDNEETPEGDACYNNSSPNIPTVGGTVMSYCHTQSVGINLSLGFGTQPGNVIRDNVNNGGCLDNCCPDVLSITQIIASGNYIFEASNSITGINEISNGAEVVFDAAAEVVLLPGFLASEGASFCAIIDGCGGSGSSVVYNDENMDIVGDYDINIKREEHNLTLFTEYSQSSVMSHSQLKVFPNPFEGTTTIEYSITADHMPVSIGIFNITGKQVSVLMDNVKKNMGIHEVVFDGTHLPAGIYYCRLKAGNQIQTKKLVLVK